jgi:hypothetical protein
MPPRLGLYDTIYTFFKTEMRTLHRQRERTTTTDPPPQGAFFMANLVNVPHARQENVTCAHEVTNVIKSSMNTQQETRVCKGFCKSELPLDNFGWRDQSQGIYQPLCRSCRAYRNRGKQHHLKRKFGITLEEYNEILESQDGVCEICKQPEKVFHGETLRALSVDHDRRCCPDEKTCGQCIRGLLCQRCNWGIGQFEKLMPRIREFIAYYRKYRQIHKARARMRV